MAAQVQIIKDGFMMGCTKVPIGKIILTTDQKAIELIKDGVAVYPGEYERRDMQPKRRRGRPRVQKPLAEDIPPE